MAVSVPPNGALTTNTPVSGSKRTPDCTGAVAVDALEVQRHEKEHAEQREQAQDDERETGRE